MEFFRRLFESDFMPHGHCYFWKPAVLWTNVLGDGITALSYYIIPFLLIYFLRKRPEVGFRPVFLGFAIFILACGTTHLIAIISVWHPMYRLEGLMKVITATVSAGTVGVLAYLMPVLLKIPTPEKLSDMAEAKQASDNRFKLMMENAPIGIAMASVDGKFVEVNRAFCDLLGYSKEELLNLDFKDITHPDFMKASIQQTTSLDDKKENIFQMEKKYLRKDGSSFWAMVNVSNLGNEPFRIAQVVDIDEKKQREEKTLADNEHLEKMVALRTNELEETNKDLENFIYVVTHDLRSPIQNLKGLTGVLKEELPDLDAGRDAAQILEMIGENAERMDHLIIDLMSFSRAKYHQVQEEKVEMTPLVKEAFDGLKNKYAKSDISFLCADLPLANGDPAVLRQVWQNLISNALKYSSTKEKIQIEVSGYEKEDEIIYKVKDYGVGFDEAYSNKLFALFQRLHTSTEFEGTGIGLATSLRLIQKHGGRMWAESELGKGATFYFALPN